MLRSKVVKTFIDAFIQLLSQSFADNVLYKLYQEMCILQVWQFSPDSLLLFFTSSPNQAKLHFRFCFVSVFLCLILNKIWLSFAFLQSLRWVMLLNCDLSCISFSFSVRVGKKTLRN